MDDRLRYWLRGGAVQNFGDHLTELLADALFYRLPPDVGAIHLIGSVIADVYVPDTATPDAPVVFWGCGVRAPDGLSLDRRHRARVLAVRGPISAAAMQRRDGAQSDLPQGDPALLLPALYIPAPAPDFAGRTVCIPHFFDQRGDAELLALSGCERVLRPNIAPGHDHLRQFIDAVCAAEFVLCAALHGAIVAAAYGKPFAFWDPGTIDVPLKWTDFAASVKIPVVFQTELAAARAHHAGAIAPALSIPPLWPLLAHAPLLLRPQALLAVLRHDAARLPEPERSAELARAQAGFAAQEPHFEALAASIRAAQEREAETARGRLRGIEQSTIWRLTHPLRRLAGSLPPAARGARMLARLLDRPSAPKAAPVPADEAARRRAVAQAGITDRQRWLAAENFEPHWGRRAVVAAGLCGDARWVCDIGCGMQTLRAHLPPGTIYLPADLRRWTPEVALCDLNARRWPHLYLACCDAAYLLGVLEYLVDPRPLFAVLRSHAAAVVLSYNAVDLASLDRGAFGFVNSWSTEQLSYMLFQAGFRITETVRFETSQIIIRAEAPAAGSLQRARQRAARAIYRRRQA